VQEVQSYNLNERKRSEQLVYFIIDAEKI
jgi:hypothetical protein